MQMTILSIAYFRNISSAEESMTLVTHSQPTA